METPASSCLMIFFFLFFFPISSQFADYVDTKNDRTTSTSGDVTTKLARQLRKRARAPPFLTPLTCGRRSPFNRFNGTSLKPCVVPKVHLFHVCTQHGPNMSLAEALLSDINVLPKIQCGDFTLELELGPLTPEMQEVARKELRETPELQKEAIETLRELLKGDTDLKCPLHSDAWLVRFLRPCKYYPQSAFELIKRYYAFKLKHANLYQGLMPSREKNVFDHDILIVLPTRDQYGRRMLVIELGKKWKHNKVSLDEIFKGAALYLEAAMLEPMTQVAGAVVMFDMDGLSMQQTWQFTPPFAKRIVDFLQESIPCRVKNIHIVNQPYIFNVVFALFKPFLKEKLKKRIIFHGTDMASLHEYISPKSLPKCYGGVLDLPRIHGNQWLELLTLCDKEYEAINSYGYKK